MTFAKYIFPASCLLFSDSKSNSQLYSRLPPQRGFLPRAWRRLTSSFSFGSFTRNRPSSRNCRRFRTSCIFEATRQMSALRAAQIAPSTDCMPVTCLIAFHSRCISDASNFSARSRFSVCRAILWPIWAGVPKPRIATSLGSSQPSNSLFRRRIYSRLGPICGTKSRMTMPKHTASH